MQIERPDEGASGGGRAIPPCGTSIGINGLGVYPPLSPPRWSADNAHKLLSGFPDAQVAGGQRRAYLATTTIYGASAPLLWGEAMGGAWVALGPRLSRR